MVKLMHIKETLGKDGVNHS